MPGRSLRGQESGAGREAEFFFMVMVKTGGSGAVPTPSSAIGVL